MSDDTKPKSTLIPGATPIHHDDPSKSSEYVCDVRIPGEMTSDNIPRALLDSIVAAFNHVKDGRGEIAQMDMPILALRMDGEPDPDLSHIGTPETDEEMEEILNNHDTITVYVARGNARAMFEGALKTLDGLKEMLRSREEGGMEVEIEHLPGCPMNKRNIQ